MVCPSIGLATSTVLVTDRSALTWTVTLTLAVLLARLGSKAAVLTVAVLVSVWPTVPLLIVAVITMVALLALAMLASVSVIWLPVLLSVKAGPAVCVWVTNVVPVGSRSLKVTLPAASGPP